MDWGRSSSLCFYLFLLIRKQNLVLTSAEDDTSCWRLPSDKSARLVLWLSFCAHVLPQDQLLQSKVNTVLITKKYQL